MFCIKLISNIEVKIRKALKRLWGVRQRVADAGAVRSLPSVTRDCIPLQT